VLAQGVLEEGSFSSQTSKLSSSASFTSHPPGAQVWSATCGVDVLCFLLMPLIGVPCMSFVVVTCVSLIWAPSYFFLCLGTLDILYVDDTDISRVGIVYIFCLQFRAGRTRHLWRLFSLLLT